MNDHVAEPMKSILDNFESGIRDGAVKAAARKPKKIYVAMIGSSNGEEYCGGILDEDLNNMVKEWQKPISFGPRHVRIFECEFDLDSPVAEVDAPMMTHNNMLLTATEGELRAALAAKTGGA